MVNSFSSCLPISSFGNNQNNFFLVPRNHAALLKVGAYPPLAGIHDEASRSGVECRNTSITYLEQITEWDAVAARLVDLAYVVV